MTSPAMKAKLRALARAYQVEKVSEAIAAALDALPEAYPPDVLEDALTRALSLHFHRRLEDARQKTAEQRAAADTPMDSEKPHG
ncbi:MAG: hypothetical protein E6R03_08695 [Hyphomicrobiaceae bacterium]|nr:MAG: hypothetical protein E6R03_08695 [Hyphomicrobiaceae bacterium]